MITQDDRTEEQKVSHKWAVVARDRFMSGWGMAANGYSRCAWAVPETVNIDRVENWVRSRKEMQYVTVVNLDTYRCPKGTKHFHIYVVNDNHPALGKRVD